jgi:DNA replication protein DnaC
MSATKPVLQAAIQQYAKQLRLPTLGDQFARLAEEAVKEKQSHLSYLEAEVEERDHRAMARRIQEARFPAVKTLEEFDFQVVPHISVAVMRNLSEGGYLTRKEPVIFLGETGTGKTHLATALAVAACRQHKRVRFTTAAEMVTELIEAKNQLELTRVRNRWTRYDLIVIDELAYVVMPDAGKKCGCDGCACRACFLRAVRRFGV